MPVGKYPFSLLQLFAQRKRLASSYSGLNGTEGVYSFESALTFVFSSPCAVPKEICWDVLKYVLI